MDRSGLNIQFPIYDGNGSPFHNLVLHKSVVESTVMSLDDKISGDVYYIDNNLDVTMQEYVTYKGVNYLLVNPPTIVKEGVVSQNSELHGMTKYSFTFYHPMYWLNEYPFADVATSADENRYLSENKTFSWIGKPDDFIDKLNKNLEGTLWFVEKSESFPTDKLDELSEVLSFDNVTIGDALKTCYETWGVPYVCDQVTTNEYQYYQGKRFKVVIGLPANEIIDKNTTYGTTLVVNTQKSTGIYYSGASVSVVANKKFLVESLTAGATPLIFDSTHTNIIGRTSITFDANTTVYLGLQGSSGNLKYYYEEDQGNVFVFKCGQGVGLKNNSRTPRNNKIVTRLSGCGSEDNIPYGYPQIIWYGDPNAVCTIGDSVGIKTNVTINGTVYPYAMSYPIYDGIVGGQYVKLIKHPFTRTHLMPTVYTDSVFNKVSPYVSGGGANTHYDPDTTLVDYYDAVATQDYPYTNEINLSAPSYEYHEFEDIKPKLPSDSALIADAIPIKNDGTVDDAWYDDQDEDGNYKQSYFKLTLPQLSFDLYACAAITQEMNINMRSGACIGCTFPVQVDWDDYKANFYDEDGNFAPNGSQRDMTKYPNSSQGSITIIVQKEYQTFGTIMPNIYQQPKSGDLFVITGISLPLSYITNAEEELDDAMKSYMLENNVYYYDYPLKFDEYFLATHTTILEQIRTNTIVRFEFADEELELFVKQISVKYGESPLPQYNITLTDNVEVVLNQIGQVVDNVDKLSSLINTLRQSYGRNVWSEINKKLSKVYDDTAAGLITFLHGILLGTEFGITEDGHATLHQVLSDNFLSDAFLGTGWGAWLDENGISTIEVDNLNVRMKALFNELEIRKISYSGGNLLFTSAGSKIMKVTPVDTDGNETTVGDAVAFRCDLMSDDGTTATMNDWMVGDQARCQMFNIKEGVYQNVSNRSYWRKVIATEERYDDNDRLINSVILAKNISGTYKGTAYANGVSTTSNDYPQDGDTIVQLGSQTNTARQNAIELVTNGDNAPALLKYQGIDNYTLDGKLIQGEYYDPTSHTFKSVTYGDWFVGDNELGGGYAEYDKATRTFSVKGKLQVGSTLEDGRDVNALGTYRGNLIQNSGFTGDYESLAVEANTTVESDTQIYNDQLICWDATNVEVYEDATSASGYSARVGTLKQDIALGMTSGVWYVLSVSYKGSINLTIGNNTRVCDNSQSWIRIDWPFVHGGNSQIVINGSGDVREIMLTAGNLPCEWRKNATDNDKSMAEYFGLEYLRNAISEASTNILGGLILSQIIKVGNYRNGMMSEETGGMSGARNDAQSPYLWGGGTMEQAIYTIAKYAQNPAYQPTDAEVDNMAKFVVTHGGRAILNDIVLRGYVYAIGGLFKGNLDVGSDSNHFILDGNTNTFKVSGPDYSADEPDYPPSPTASIIDLFKIFTSTDPDTLQRICRMIMTSSSGDGIEFDALDGIAFTYPTGYGKTLKITKDGITLSVTDSLTDIWYETNLTGDGLDMKVHYPNGYRHLGDDVEEIGYYANGTIYLKKTTSGVTSGTLTVDSNGFLKLTS